MQQAPPARSAHLHPLRCGAAGSGQAVLPAAVPGLAGLAGWRQLSSLDEMLPTTQSERF